jgi:hypothetical protein
VNVVKKAAKATGSRYLDNDTTELLDSGDTETALEDIDTNFPPKHRYSPEALHWLWSGPTGIGYLLLQVSSLRPDLVICDKAILEWARALVDTISDSAATGVVSPMSDLPRYEAVLAAVSEDMQHVREFVSSAAQVSTVDEFPDENLYGRAGLLYLLRGPSLGPGERLDGQPHHRGGLKHPHEACPRMDKAQPPLSWGGTRRHWHPSPACPYIPRFGAADGACCSRCLGQAVPQRKLASVRAHGQK